ncbi:glycosyl hydrolase [Colletotrichum lupini]|uniref:Glycosyl hydrolase n=1 Tax=Colletotrichum lupini TaxID=145971 RepID=A0A9Q8SEA8_9PEZI|nr:glycosyl hydrolase [Colletotrichum lupini]UQC75371.1 glycosyl hydrolase [Colletotrichum lupini]
MFTTLLAAVAIAASHVAHASTSATPSLLLFSKTAGYRHARHLVSSIANEKGWSVAATEDSAIFTNGSLSAYSTLVFISTTGNYLSTNESDALNDFLLNGGSWLGIHAAGDFGDDMPNWFTKLVGAQKERYPPNGNIRPDIVTILDFDHPSTSGLPESHNRTDEWYAYKTNPADDSAYKVLAKVEETYIDEITLSPELQHMPPMHSISWYSMYEGVARAFYTGMGHTNESYSEEYFVKHVTGGLEWVTGTSN